MRTERERGENRILAVAIGRPASLSRDGDVGADTIATVGRPGVLLCWSLDARVGAAVQAHRG